MKLHMILSITSKFATAYYAKQREIVSQYDAFVNEVNACPALKELIGETFIDLICNLFVLDRKNAYDSMATNFSKDHDAATWSSSENEAFNTLLRRFDEYYVKANCAEHHQHLRSVLENSIIKANWKCFVRGLVDNTYYLLTLLHTNITSQTQAERLLLSYDEVVNAHVNHRSDLSVEYRYLYREAVSFDKRAVFIWADSESRQLCLTAREENGEINHTYFQMQLDNPAIIFKEQNRVYSSLLQFIHSAAFPLVGFRINGNLNEAKEIDLYELLPFCVPVAVDDEQHAENACAI